MQTHVVMPDPCPIIEPLRVEAREVDPLFAHVAKAADVSLAEVIARELEPEPDRVVYYDAFESVIS